MRRRSPRRTCRSWSAARSSPPRRISWSLLAKPWTCRMTGSWSWPGTSCRAARAEALERRACACSRKRLTARSSPRMSSQPLPAFWPGTGRTRTDKGVAVLEELENAGEIKKATERLLGAAAARGRLPTPVDDLVRAAGLTEPAESILSESVLRRAPQHIRDAVVPFKFKVKALLDRKAREIHVAEGVEHRGQRDFKRLHEVGHDILPSQRKLAYADDYQIGLASVVDLSELFGASIHATFRRYVETHRSAMAGIVLDSSPVRRIPLTYHRREAVHSPAWSNRFAAPRSWPSHLHGSDYAFLAAADQTPTCATSSRLEIALPSLDGDRPKLLVESFSN